MPTPRAAAAARLALVPLLALAAACGAQGPIAASPPPTSPTVTAPAVPATSPEGETSGGSSGMTFSDSAQAAAGTAGGATADVSSLASVGLITQARPLPSTIDNVCTGTVVAPRLVLTAAHCLLAIDQSGLELPQVAIPANIEFHLGASLPTLSAPLASDNYAGVKIYLPGGANFPLNAFVANLRGLTTNTNDLAVLEVDHDLRATALPVQNAPLTQAAVNQGLTVPGYGSTGGYSAQIDGTRRVADVSLTAFDANVIQTQASPTTQHVPCSGDSGAPALLRNTIQGVVSGVRTDASGACTATSFFIRLDPWLNFLSNLS